MVDAMRAMLDELMGKERDLPPEQRTGRGISYKDAEICKYALAGLCPYGLFKNTKSDLGLCKYEVHDDDVEYGPAKEEWDRLPDEEKEKYGYRKELLELLKQLVRDMDRKIERQKERAAKESEARLPTPAEQTQLNELIEKEKAALKQSEESAEAGNVDASMLYTQQAEGFKKEHDELYAKFTMPERTMTVCEVCGVFINSTDNDQRKADHLAGKQYLGWQAIRDKLKEIQKDDDERTARRPERPREADRERHRSRDRERDHSRKHREHEEQHRSSRSERHRERDRRDRRRSRSRDRHRGSEVPPPSSYSRSGRRDREYY